MVTDMPNSRFAVAIHILAVLASKKGEPVPSPYIASSVNTNPVVIRRILAALAKARIVASEKGPAGGSRLARRPSAITLGEVYRALGEGPLFPVHKNPENKRCPVSCRMKEALGAIFGRAQSAVEKELERVSVGEVLG